MTVDKERLIPTSITEIMQSAYIDYSMSVIISRALPDARDGLKPVQRRVLYAMFRERLLHNRPFDKCAGVVGEVLKNYHPHGDISVYHTLVRMAQHWVMRYPLIIPQGNFGSIDGDPPAAYRYTEAKLQAKAEDLLREIGEDTVDFVPNYKESSTEPSVLPAALPNLLMNGSTGIAVGMTTNIPPHNLGELIDAACAIIDNPNISIDDILTYIPGPDFPTGGAIAGSEGIESYMRTGRGIIRVKGTVGLEDLSSGKQQIIISEIPYYVNRSSLVTKIAELINNKVMSEISDLRDESDENTRIVVEVKRGDSPRVVINKLYKHTQLESSFGAIMLALVKRRPKQMNIKEMIECFIEHRREVATRRTQYRLNKAEDRAHVLEGYKIALNNLDDIVKIIRASSNRDAARGSLMAKYPITERQTNAILDLRLYQLTGLEREMIEAEYINLIQLIGELKQILESESKLLSVIKEELMALKKRYPSQRRTKILEAEREFRMEDIIANEGCVISVSHKGLIKRTSVRAYRSQRRGGKGVIGSGSYQEDFIEHVFTANTHDNIMFFMNNGRVYGQKVYEIPEGTRIAKGRSIANLLEMRAEEKIASMICVPEFSEELHLVQVTRKGVVKKTNLKAYANYRRDGIIGIKIDAGDQLIDVLLTGGDNEIIIITQNGMSIRFRETDLRDQGRATRGVKGITLKKGDYVNSAVVEDPGATLLIVGENGLGKRSYFGDYRLQNRGGIGVIAIKTSRVAGALAVKEEDEIMILTLSGQAIRSPVKDVRVIGRATQGVRLMNLATDDKIVAAAKVVDTEDIDESEEGQSAAESPGIDHKSSS